MFVFYIFKTRGGLQQGERGLEVRRHGAGQAIPLDIHCRCHRWVNNFSNITIQSHRLCFEICNNNGFES